jgi:hypothetical protein
MRFVTEYFTNNMIPKINNMMIAQVGTVGGRVDGGLMACVVGIVREEGAPALYRGLTPALCRQGPVMLVQMPLIEQLRSALGLEFL